MKHWFPLIILVQASALHAEVSLESGKAQWEAGKPFAARKTLLQIPTHSPQYVPALVILQKIHFEKQMWQAFFGHALYYRKKLLKPQTIEPRLLQMEALALAHHCRFERAQEVMALWNLMEPHSPSELWKRTQIKLSQLQNTPSETLPQVEVPPLFFHRETYWKIPPHRTPQLDHPRNLRVVVQSQCSAPST